MANSTPTAPVAALASLPLTTALKSTFTTPKYSDQTIACGDQRWQVHKIIVCSQSPVFAKACDGHWKEGEENLITLAEDDPSVVNEMLRFMYTFDYGTEIVSGSGPEGQAPMLTDVAVHIIADKYDIEPLADLAASKFYQRAATEWCTEGFASAAALVYTAAADREHELRNATMAVATRHAHSLRTEEAGTHFREVMGAVPPLALALWEKQVDAHVDSKAATDTLLDAVARFRDDLDAAEAELMKKANVKKYKCPNPTCAWRVSADNVIESVATWSCLVCGQPHCKHFWLANVV